MSDCRRLKAHYYQHSVWTKLISVQMSSFPVIETHKFQVLVLSSISGGRDLVRFANQTFIFIFNWRQRWCFLYKQAEVGRYYFLLFQENQVVLVETFCVLKATILSQIRSTSFALTSQNLYPKSSLSSMHTLHCAFYA